MKKPRPEKRKRDTKRRHEGKTGKAGRRGEGRPRREDEKSLASEKTGKTTGGSNDLHRLLLVREHPGRSWSPPVGPRQQGLQRFTRSVLQSTPYVVQWLCAAQQDTKPVVHGRRPAPSSKSRCIKRCIVVLRACRRWVGRASQSPPVHVPVEAPMEWERTLSRSGPLRLLVGTEGRRGARRID